MAERFNVIAAQRGKNSKVYWNRIGSAWQRDDGGMSVSLHSMPAPSEGEFRFIIVHDDGQRGGKLQAEGQAKSGADDDDLDSEIPF